MYVLTQCSKTHLSLFYNLDLWLKYKFFSFAYPRMFPRWKQMMFCLGSDWNRNWNWQKTHWVLCTPNLTLTCLTLAHALINSPIISQSLRNLVSIASVQAQPSTAQFHVGFHLSPTVFPPVSISLSLSLLPRGGSLSKINENICQTNANA